MKMNLRPLIWFFLFLIVIVPVLSQTYPDNLQKIIDYNKEATSDFAVNISFFIAFIAGILVILSPCALPFLPAYMSYTFKEKKNITKMTLVFFSGFTLVFIFMGIVAGIIGEQTLRLLQNQTLIQIIGIFIIILGLITLKGKKICNFIKLNKFNNDVPGTFLFGMFFATGWTACLGPILGGILGIGAILGNVWYSAILLFFYGLGNFVPLFLISLFYDKFNLEKSKIIKGKMFNIKIFNKNFYIHSTNLIAGIMFILIGSVLIIFRGTSVVNKYDIFGTKEFFYIIQRELINWNYANILSISIFILFILLLWGFLKKNWKNK